MILFENAVIHSAQTSSTLLKGVLDLSIGQFSARIWLLRTENYCIPDFGIFGTKIWIFPICFHKHITRYFIVLLDTSMDFQILLRTFQYFLGLLGTSWYFSILLDTSWYFLVLLRTSPYFSVLPGTSPYFHTSEVQKYACSPLSDCDDMTLENLNLTAHSSKSIEIYAFEPQPSTFEILSKVQHWMNVPSVFLHNVALSNRTGTASIMRCPAGGESCGLATEGDVTGNQNFINVHVDTLDNFMEQKNISQTIDVLKIDAEGFDPLVLKGAERILGDHRVRLLLFEYNGIGMWPSTNLYQVIAELGERNYMCYKIGRTGILPLTGCWSPKFEIKFWSNVLCLSIREQRLIRFIEKLLIKVWLPAGIDETLLKER